jgi:hypothetical protein
LSDTLSRAECLTLPAIVIVGSVGIEAMDYDADKVDEAVLALLILTVHLVVAKTRTSFRPEVP